MKVAMTVLLALLALPAGAVPVTITCGEEAAALCDGAALADLTARMTRERDLVAAFLGLSSDQSLAVHLGDSWRGRPVEVTRAWPEFGRVVIPPRILARGIAPTAHEITHVLAGRGASVVLSEGLAVLAQARFGAQPAFPNFDRSLRVALFEQLNRVPPFDAPPRLDQVERWADDFADPARRRLGYLIAGLFCEYLLTQRFGGDPARFLRLYRSGDYVGALGDGGEAVFARWWAGRAA